MVDRTAPAYNGIECWCTVAGPFFCNKAQYKRNDSMESFLTAKR